MACFLSVICNVLVFYLFSTLRFNRTLQGVLGGDIKVATMFQVSGRMIGIFAVIFLWYSTSCFLTKRKQEGSGGALVRNRLPGEQQQKFYLRQNAGRGGYFPYFPGNSPSELYMDPGTQVGGEGPAARQPGIQVQNGPVR